MEAVVQSVELSTFSDVIRSTDGTIIAYWGWRECSVIGSQAFMWMLSTPAADIHPVTYARATRKIVDGMFETHQQLFCMADREYTRSLLWLDWLGFKRYADHGRFIQLMNTRGGAA